MTRSEILTFRRVAVSALDERYPGTHRLSWARHYHIWAWISACDALLEKKLSRKAGHENEVSRCLYWSAEYLLPARHTTGLTAALMASAILAGPK